MADTASVAKIISYYWIETSLIQIDYKREKMALYAIALGVVDENKRGAWRWVLEVKCDFGVVDAAQSGECAG